VPVRGQPLLAGSAYLRRPLSGPLSGERKVAESAFFLPNYWNRGLESISLRQRVFSFRDSPALCRSLRAARGDWLTAACLIAELGDPARFRSAGAIASYVDVAPRLRQSGKKRFSGSPTIPFGNARLRKTLWMVVLNAVRCNPWLRQYYERLRAAGKPGKGAVIAAMRKLLTAVWSVATHRRAFVPHLSPIPATASAMP
jgi:transposase IS116/IS110/IS902 family protein